MKIFTLFILLTACYACSLLEENSCESIAVEKALANMETLSVMDFGKHAVYVPLETTEESLIGKRAYVRMLKDKLLVGSFQQPIKMFDKKNGKFIRLVGNIGQGANEYTLQNNIPIFWTDDVSDIIYVQTEGKRLVRFDVNGNPLDGINLPNSFPPMTAVSQITTGNKLYIYQQTLFNELNYKIRIQDLLSGEVSEGILNEEKAIPYELSQTPLIFEEFGNIPVPNSCIIFTLTDDRMVFHYTEEPCLWAFDKQVFFKESFNDTIYRVLENQLKPRLVFNLGNKHCAYEDRHNVIGSQNKIHIDYVLEGINSIFFVFQTNYYNLKDAKTYWGVYNKKDKSVKVTDKLQIEDPANHVFIDKLQTATSDGLLVGLMDAFSFTENINMEKYYGVSEDDNPVVVIIE